MEQPLPEVYVFFADRGRNLGPIPADVLCYAVIRGRFLVLLW